jgi:catechol 2,3-dioxygenase-like lactoylglutathione lyase family enzyme
MITLNHVALPSRSFENADRFFHGILGLEKIKTSVLEPDLALALFGRAEPWDIVLYRGWNLAIEVFVSEVAPPPLPSIAHLCLEVENREAFLARCRLAGLAVIRAPRGEAVVVFIQDFDGNRYEIKEKL